MVFRVSPVCKKIRILFNIKKDVGQNVLLTTRFSALGGSPPTRITVIYTSKQKNIGDHLKFYPDHFLPDHKQTIYNQVSIWFFLVIVKKNDLSFLLILNFQGSPHMPKRRKK